MSNIRRKILLNVFKLFDMAVLIAAFAGAAALLLPGTHASSFAEFLAMRVRVGNLLIFTGLLALWHYVFLGCGLYASRRLSRRSDEFLDVIKAVSLATLLLGAGALVFRIKMATPQFLLTFWFFSGALI